ncbi:MAG: pilin [Kiloniellales bacterium]|nr:pilin [Kiloniellales bacterium]
MSKFRCLVMGASGAVLVLLAAAVLIPAYGDYLGRATLSEVLAELESYRHEIAEKATNQGTMENAGVGVAISPEDSLRLGVNYARIFSDGTIVFRHGRYEQVIVWEPTMAGGNVTWRCVGGPRKSVPPWCR